MAPANGLPIVKNWNHGKIIANSNLITIPFKFIVYILTKKLYEMSILVLIQKFFGIG
jgi:hypothetical protein